MADLRVLVTGGTGYVGSRLGRALSERCRLSLGFHREPDPALRQQLPGVEWVRCPLDDGAALEEACRGKDAVIHLAGKNASDCDRNPREALSLSILGTWDLLEACRRQEVRRILFLSTIHVYGSPLRGTLTETSPTDPRHPYATARRAAEELIQQWAAKNRREAVVLRLSNAVGAPVYSGVNAWMLVANDLCRMAVQEKKLTLKSSGLQWRNFVSLGDVEEAVWHFLRLPREALQDGLFNLAGPESVRVRDFAARLAETAEMTLGFRPPLTWAEPNGSDFTEPHHIPTEKLRTTGFESRVSLDEEIKATLLACRQWWGQ